MMAAPNRSRITARVEDTSAVEGAPKWYLTVNVVDAAPIEGGLFVHPGDTARVFVVGEAPDLRPDDVFTAEVEYLGGPDGGELQLLHLEERSTPDVVTRPSIALALGRSAYFDDAPEGGLE